MPFPRRDPRFHRPLPPDARPVVGASRYSVTPDGHVYRFDGKEMTRGANQFGYLRVSIYTDDGGRKTRMVHVLVAAAFIGPKPPGLEVNHINGDKGDPRVENLEYVTQSANTLHAYQVLGRTRLRGEIQGNSKLTTEVVREIRSKYASGVSSRELAAMYSVNQGHIQRVVNRSSWAHVA